MYKLGSPLETLSISKESPDIWSVLSVFPSKFKGVTLPSTISTENLTTLTLHHKTYVRDNRGGEGGERDRFLNVNL